MRITANSAASSRLPGHQSSLRVFTSCTAALAFTLVTATHAQEAGFEVPRTVDGVPDLQGMWTSNTITPFSRPEEFGDKLVLTREEAMQLEQAAEVGGPAPAAGPRGATRVIVERPRFNLLDYLWTGSLGLLASLGQAVVVVFTAFFLLASGDHFRRKLVHLAGPTFAKRRLTVQTLDEISAQVQRYLLVQVFTSAVVGLTIWLAFLAVGMEHAAVWGVTAFVLDFVPYVGATVLTASAGLMSFVQFGSVDMVLLVSGIALGVHTLSGNLLMPWLSSRSSRMNAVTVFIGVLAFGWLWGLWGLLLGVPILASVKAVCDRVEELKPVGELMGD